MLRRFSLLFTLGFVFSTTDLHASPVILKELKNDLIELDPSAIYDDMNPLRRVIRPDVNEKALEYEYHAWSEIDAKGDYTVYRWELIVQEEKRDVYQLAMYKNSPPKEEDFYKELSEQEQDSLFLDMQSGVILGALTKTTLAVEPKTDSEKFLLISKRPLKKVVAPVEAAPMIELPREEPVVPAPPPPAPPKDDDTAEVAYAEPVPGQKGFVYSKKLDPNGRKQLIDVRDMEPGQKAKDPYDQTIFRVPLK